MFNSLVVAARSGFNGGRAGLGIDDSRSFSPVHEYQ